MKDINSNDALKDVWKLVYNLKQEMSIMLLELKYYKECAQDMAEDLDRHTSRNITSLLSDANDKFMKAYKELDND